MLYECSVVVMAGQSVVNLGECKKEHRLQFNSDVSVLYTSPIITGIEFRQIVFVIFSDEFFIVINILLFLFSCGFVDGLFIAKDFI